MLDYRPDFPTLNPQFDFPAIARGLVPLLKADVEEGATVLGLHGPWGSGKTTLMKAIQREIRKDLPSSIAIEFNAWKFQDREALWRALILHVLAELRDIRMDAWLKEDENRTPSDFKDPAITQIEDRLYRAFTVDESGPWKIQWKTLIVETLTIGLSVLKLGFVGTALKASGGFWAGLFGGGKAEGKEGKKDEAVLDHDRIKELAGVLEREVIHRQMNQIQSIEQFLSKFQDMVREIAAQGRIYVYIDDLDRCLPESALEIFEAIKLFMDAPGINYVIALDRDTIRKALAVRYNRRGDAANDQIFLDPDEYIEKTVTVSFDLPKLSPDDDALWFIQDIRLPLRLSDAERKTIVGALGTNPRRLKRFMNTLAVNLHIAAEAGRVEILDQDPVARALFLKLLLISYRYSGVFAMAREDDQLLIGLQEISNVYVDDRDDLEKARDVRRKSVEVNWVLASRLVDREDFWKLMALKPQLNDDPAALSGMMQWFRFRPHKADV